jgi:hypothetical protein
MGKDDYYSDKEAAKRRDQTIRNMVMTPPQPKPSRAQSKKGKPWHDE